MGLMHDIGEVVCVGGGGVNDIGEVVKWCR